MPRFHCDFKNVPSRLDSNAVLGALSIFDDPEHESVRIAPVAVLHRGVSGGCRTWRMWWSSPTMPPRLVDLKAVVIDGSVATVLPLGADRCSLCYSCSHLSPRCRSLEEPFMPEALRSAPRLVTTKEPSVLTRHWSPAISAMMRRECVADTNARALDRAGRLGEMGRADLAMKIQYPSLPSLDVQCAILDAQADVRADGMRQKRIDDVRALKQAIEDREKQRKADAYAEKRRREREAHAEAARLRDSRVADRGKHVARRDLAGTRTHSWRLPH